MLSNCGAGEDYWESLEKQGDQTSQRKSTLNTLERIDAEDEAPILWPPDVKNQLTGKEPGSGENLGQEEKGMTEDKTVRWHHQFIGHELGQTPGDGEGQGSLVCCSPWGHEESDMTWWLNSNKDAVCFSPGWFSCLVTLVSGGGITEFWRQLPVPATEYQLCSQVLTWYLTYRSSGRHVLFTCFYSKVHLWFSSFQPLSRVWLCDPMDCSAPGFPVHYQLPAVAQTHIHRVSDAI